jgi:3-deoxy-D-manno-octulosonic-acid transferase
LKRPWQAGVWAAAATLAGPILRLSLRRRAARGKEIPARLPERWGMDATPRPPGRLIWLHAASVGETMSILPVLSALAASGVTILLTTGTVTSAELLAQRLPELGLSDRVLHRFAPLDVPAWAARFLDHWRPDAAGFVESELWPNLLDGCRARGIPMMLINARISAGSMKAWRRAPALARSVLGHFARIHARGQEDADRLRALGAEGVSNPGDLKFAAPPLPADPAVLAGLRAQIGARPVWVAASTHPGEEAEVAVAHRLIAARHPDLLTIVAPRHPDRGADLAAALQAPRRGAGEPPPAGDGLWVADTLGELGLWYRLARGALVGRSLLPPGGGQNPLEPARLHCPVIVGPYMANFTDPVARLRAADAILEVTDAASLAAAVCELLRAESASRARAERAFEAVQLYANLPAFTAEALLGLLPPVP